VRRREKQRRKLGFIGDKCDERVENTSNFDRTFIQRSILSSQFQKQATVGREILRAGDAINWRIAKIIAKFTEIHSANGHKNIKNPVTS
jgi:hypothetical protein